MSLQGAQFSPNMERHPNSMPPTDPLPILSAERAQAFAQRARDARDVPVDEKLLEADLRERVSAELRKLPAHDRPRPAP
jgi:hypothetical protein